MNLRIRHIEQRQDVIGAIFLEEKIVEGGVAHFPSMHQQTLDLIFAKVEPVFPQIAILEIAVFPRLDIVGVRREKALKSPEDSENGECDPVVRRDIGGIIHRIGKESRLLGLSLLIHAQQQVSKHRGRVIHEGGRKNQRDRRRIQLFEPGSKALAGLRRQTGFVNRERSFQPMITGDESTACRLARSPDEFGGKKLRDRRLKFGLGIDLAVGCEKEAGFVGLAFIAADKRWTVVQQQMPITLLVQSGSRGAPL